MYSFTFYWCNSRNGTRTSLIQYTIYLFTLFTLFLPVEERSAQMNIRGVMPFWGLSIGEGNTKGWNKKRNNTKEFKWQYDVALYTYIFFFSNKIQETRKGREEKRADTSVQPRFYMNELRMRSFFSKKFLFIFFPCTPLIEKKPNICLCFVVTLFVDCLFDGPFLNKCPRDICALGWILYDPYFICNHLQGI